MILSLNNIMQYKFKNISNQTPCSNQTQYKLINLLRLNLSQQPSEKITLIHQSNDNYFYIMTNRTDFRITKISPTNHRAKRMHSEETRKSSFDTNFVKLDSQVSRVFQVSQNSPTSTTSSLRRSFIDINQKEHIRKISNKIKNPHNSSFGMEVQPELLLNSIKHNKKTSQNVINLIKVPFDHNLEIKTLKKDNFQTSSGSINTRKFSDNTINSSKEQQLQSFLDMQVYSNSQKILQQLSNYFLSEKIIQFIKKYVEMVNSGVIDNYYELFPTNKQKIIKKSIEYERVAVILVAFNHVNQTTRINQNFLSNLLKLISQNRTMILAIIQKQNSRKYSEAVQNHEQKDSKQLHQFEITKNNVEIILSLLMRLTSQKNYFSENVRWILKSTEMSIQKYFRMLLQRFSFYLHKSHLDPKIPCFAVSPSPYLPPTNKYTLVIDIIQVMYNENSQSCRPYSQSFIQQLSKFFEIVSFSAKLPNDIQAQMRFVDRKNLIAHKLYKQHFINDKGTYKKDLQRIGRSLSKIILLDTETNELNPQNCYVVKKWIGNSDDNILPGIIKFLTSIALKKLNVQDALTNTENQQVKKKTHPRKLKYMTNMVN